MSLYSLPERLSRHKPIFFMWAIVFAVIAFTYALRPEVAAFSAIYSNLSLFFAFVSIIFVGSFWMVYYFGLLSQGESRLKFLDVFTLRDFLNEKSLTRRSLAENAGKSCSQFIVSGNSWNINGYNCHFGDSFPAGWTGCKIYISGCYGRKLHSVSVAYNSR